MEKESTTQFLKGLLPSGYGALIKERLNLAISERQVQRIIDAGILDEYGVMDEAVKLAAKEKKRRERVQEQLQKLGDPNT